MIRSIRGKGMTMIEAVVWISVFISAMFALTTSVLYFYRTSNYTIQQATATASAQHGIDLMVRTIREASYASNGAYPVVSLAANDFKFYADVDSDVGIERVHYYLSGLQLFKGVTEPTGDPAVYTGVEATSSVSEYVQNLNQSSALFAYYDKNGAQITDYSKIADVRFVAANLLIDVDTNKTPIPLSLRSTAAMRNLIGH
jgi:type II secretory pathway pseudopilin PulG